MSDKDSKSTETFSEHAIYEQIFQIFEFEFQEIGKFVAFTDANASTHSTKIHNLHLRVCSEVENVLKLIVHEHFVPKAKVDDQWNAYKQEKLSKKKVLDDYRLLNSKLNNKERREVDQGLFGYPDFAFYYRLAVKHFHLNQKRVTFKAGISDGDRWKSMIPFELPNGVSVPFWWTHYNKLKHDKVASFSECTLGDLGHAMGALYILMNYLIIYQNENGHIRNPDYNRYRRNGGKPLQNNPLFCAYNSNFFEATCLVQNARLADILQEEHTRVIFNEMKPVKFTNRPNEVEYWSPDDWLKLQKTLKDAELDSVEWGKVNGAPDNCIYYGFVAYENIPLSENSDPHVGLAHFAKFCN